MFNPKKDAIQYSLTELKRMKDEKLVPESVLDSLRQKADEFMNEPNLSVVKSKLLAMSGNPHDYTSMGTYWWPNPDTPNGLPYIRKDGIGRPGANDRNNPQKLGIIVDTLALAAFYFDNDEYAKRAVDFLYDWFINPDTYMTPHAKYSQAIPGICDGRGIGLIDFRYSYRIMSTVRLLEAMGAIDPEIVKGIENWYSDFTDWMLTSEIGMEADLCRNNHGTWYDTQILASAVFLGRKRLAEKIMKTFYDRRIKPQTTEDGSQPHELARTHGIIYSLMNAQGYLAFARIAEKQGNRQLFEVDSDRGVCILKSVIDYIYPYVKDPETFPLEEYSRDTVKKNGMPEHHMILAERFPEENYPELAKEYLKDDMLWRVKPRK